MIAPVPDDLVDAALLAAEELGKDVADVPVVVIARHAGVSRSTLLRRLGGSRIALDDAVRARGVDPGGIPPVRTRAMAACATLIDEKGLAAITLEAIATRAACSVPSLYATFGSRDGLLQAVFERHSPLLDIEDFFDEPPGDLHSTVRSCYGVLAQALDRAPRVVHAMYAEALARPDGPAVQSVISHVAPRMVGVLSRWLTGEIAAGRIRDLPIPILIQLLLGPMLIQTFVRPALERADVIALPDTESTCDAFADAFVRAVVNPQEGDEP